ncbi:MULTISPECIES: phage tail fiber domain-containing protein [Pseudomonas syringae group]|uniref:phage tail fiber domain-containing protein n=1 Tax=Pseudomonas syringae group TaxID=136849 RepID=UPI00141A54C1|nr:MULTISPECIES: phage tail fiber protein [Pseudomonas syringae group]MBI6848640.1 hypothetical protein [Pseudomonas syringae]
MAVQAGPTDKRYDANGITTTYPIPFLLLDAGDLQVQLNGAVITAGFTLAGVGNPASSITFTTAPLGDLYLALNIPFQRLTDYQENGEFRANTVNRDYDRIWQALKQLLRYAGRALTLGFADIDGAGSYQAKGNRISGLGDPVAPQDAVTKSWLQSLIDSVNSPLLSIFNIYYDGISLYQFLKTGVARNVDNIAALRSLDGTRNQRAFVRDNSAVGDRFGAMWWVNPADTTSVEDLSKGIVVGNDGARWYFSGPGAMSLGQQGLSALNDNGIVWGYRSTGSSVQGNGNKFNFFKLEVANDNVSQVAGQNGATGSKVNGIHMFHNFGGPLAKGGRHAGDFVLIQGFGGGGITAATNQDRNYVGIQGQVLTDCGDGGTSAADVRGAYFGGSAFGGVLGGNRIANLTAFEFNTEITAGAGTRVAIHTGIQIASKIGERGYGIDAAVSIGNLGGSPRGWLYGICGHGANGAPAFEADSTVIKIFPSASGSAAIDKVIDTTGVTVNSIISSDGVNLRRGVLDMNAPSSQVSIGSTASANTPRVQLKSSGLNVTYDAAIFSSGGTATTGEGFLTFLAGAGIITNTSKIRPQVDNFTQIGEASFRISQITLATAPVVTSDLREKDDIEPLTVGLDFLRAIEPIQYTCRESGSGETSQRIVRVDKVVVPDEEEYEEQVVELSIEDDKAIRTFSTVKKMRQIMDTYPEFDADGQRVMVMVKIPDGTYVDPETGDKKIQFREELQESSIQVGRMKTVDVEVYEADIKKDKGCRLHFGLGAQQVKEAMTAVGIDDFAGWVLSDKDDPESRQGLRYEQFIAVLINGVNQLNARLERLEKQSDV